jgi:hypothetical protein
MVTLKTPVPFCVAAKTPVPVELEDRPMEVFDPTLTGLPNASWTWTVTGPSEALEDAWPESAPELKTSLLAAAGLTVKATDPLTAEALASVAISVLRPAAKGVNAEPGDVVPLVKVTAPVG